MLSTHTMHSLKNGTAMSDVINMATSALVFFKCLNQYLPLFDRSYQDAISALVCVLLHVKNKVYYVLMTKHVLFISDNIIIGI